MTRTIAIGNQKGGIGKTSITLGLADALSYRGKSVLVVDLDPQAHATYFMGVPVDDDTFTINDVIGAVKGRTGIGVAADAIMESGEAWPENVHLIPSDRELAARVGDVGTASEKRLRKALEGATEDYDFVLIDCPPSLDNLTENALVAADDVLVVTEPKVGSALAIGEFLNTIQGVQDDWHDGLGIVGIVVNKYMAQTVSSQYWENEIEGAYSEVAPLIKPYVPGREAVDTAASRQQPLSVVKGKGSSGKAEVWHALKRIADQL
jgi:chromosome partitioning protein